MPETPLLPPRRIFIGRTRYKGTMPKGAEEHLIVKGHDGLVVFGKDVVIAKETEIYFAVGGGKLVIGPKVKLQGKFRISDGSTVTIGRGTAINRHSYFVAAEGADITIGARCLFSDVIVRTSDMHSILDEHGDRSNPSRSVVIEDEVWLAERSYVSKGVTIGKGSIIAANAVVVKSVAEKSLVVGNPGKTVRTGVGWKRSRLPLDPLPAAPLPLSPAHEDPKKRSLMDRLRAAFTAIRG